MNDDDTDADIYWSMVLCHYGIAYVQDPLTNQRIPTINRMQYNSVFTDADYLLAVQYASSQQKELYQHDAETIAEVQKKITRITQSEKPFDVFICYKEADEYGRRTLDSVLAEEIYHSLTKEKLRVFFSRITLAKKLGSEYEPYIFSALHSAPVMVVVGTQANYLDAVWVRNEWSRYLGLIQAGERKTLIPVYRKMSIKDLPTAFASRQCLNMDDVGYLTELKQAIRKLLVADKSAKATGKSTASSLPANATIQRVFVFLEDGNWKQAEAACEKILKKDPLEARAYLGKLMCDLQIRTTAGLSNSHELFHDNENFKKAIRYGDAGLRKQLREAERRCQRHLTDSKLTLQYDYACHALELASDSVSFGYAGQLFYNLDNYRDAPEKMRWCLEKQRQAANEECIQQAIILTKDYRYEKIAKGIEILENNESFHDEKVLKAAHDRLEPLKVKEEERKAKEEERKAKEEKRKNSKWFF